MGSQNEFRCIEECVLRLDCKFEDDSWPQWKDLCSGRYFKVFDSYSARGIFMPENKPESPTLEAYFSNLIENYLSQGSVESQQDALLCGIACLQAFVQANWTGPTVDEVEILNRFPWLKGSQNIEFDSREEVCSYLALDAESLAPCVVLPHLLLIARIILYTHVWRLSDLQSSRWWSMRYLFVHQQVLEERSPQIHDAVKKLLGEVHNQEIVAASSTDSQLRTLFNIECAIIYLYYFEVLRSKEYLESAAKGAGLDISLAGALGVRTRYQKNNIAQLTLNVKSSNCSEVTDIQNSCDERDFPKDLQLNDDVRLDQIKFLNSDDGALPNLRPLDQAVIFGDFILKMKSQPKDKLADEELMAYITCLLSQPRVWCLQLTALLERCRLESNHSRTVERSMMQAQVLVDSIKAEKPDADVRHRYFYCCRMPPSWKVEADLAQLFLSLGAVNSALDIFLRLQLWEEVIVCYTILELKHKAIEIIEQQLAVKETPKLWCLLGDAKGDVSCYEKAWELSGHKSARAQRHWGLHYYFKAKYAEAIPYMKQSLDINSLQLLLWSRLGFSALSVENWELAASAYRRYCSLDTENFEAWNNLAKAYVKLGQKARAWKALQEALKCNYENWRVWDNLMAVSTDCGEFEEVIRAYHRILDLKEKHVDTEVLEILVGAVVKNEPDNHGIPAGRLKEKSLALFGRLTSQVLNNAKTWILYAKLVAGTSEQSAESSTKVAQLLQKGHRSAVQAPNWEKDIKSCSEVLEITINLADAYLECVQNCPANQVVQLLSSAKFAIRGVVSKVKQYHVDSVTQEVISQDILPLLTKVEEKLEIVSSEIMKHQVSN
ncbi:tetratricopeptide repeat protein 27 [Ischnura elegans]|uniref:tetratricopeptide repeat protein 27 n=1 Tax=Ischnura elegans TaxID=197161 RepID=UPI001ED8BE48|nr:tetratricopeptide repeat protein 27 [Ischnura elegans]